MMGKLVRSEISMTKFEKEEQERSQFAPVQPFPAIKLTKQSIEQRRKASLNDYWKFDKIYFTPDMYSEGYSQPAKFHLELADISQIHNSVQIVLAPRKHGKTVMMKKFLTWLLCTEKLHFAGVLSSTLPTARNILRDIADLILTNPRINFDYPLEIIENNSDQLTFRLKGAKKTSRLLAFSEGRSVRGATKLFDRPEFLLVDDIETRNSSVSMEHSIERGRVLSEAFNSMSVDGTMVVLGNNFHESSLMNLLKNQFEQGILNPKWQVHVYKAWDNSPLWAERYPAKSETELRELLGAWDESEWQSDYQQNPVPADGFIFQRLAELPVWDILPNDCRGVIYCDPNLAKKGKGDTTAAVCFSYSPTTDKYYIQDLICRSFSDSNKLLDTVLFLNRHNIYTIGWDGNVNQESQWTQHIRNWCLVNKLPYPRVEYRRYNVDELAKNVQGLWNEGRILFPDSHLDTEDGKRFLMQLYSFAGKKAGRTDDAPDALICANELLHERHLGRRSNANAYVTVISDHYYL
jgi:hypothetical protein